MMRQYSSKTRGAARHCGLYRRTSCRFAVDMVLFDTDHCCAYRHSHGDKAATSLIWKGAKKPIQKSGVVYVAYLERARMNSEIIIRWIDLMFPALLNFCDGKGIMWDSMRAHIANDVKAKCISKKIDVMVIPGGLTPYCRQGTSEYSSR